MMGEGDAEHRTMPCDLVFRLQLKTTPAEVPVTVIVTRSRVAGECNCL